MSGVAAVAAATMVHASRCVAESVAKNPKPHTSASREDGRDRAVPWPLDACGRSYQNRA